MIERVEAGVRADREDRGRDVDRIRRIGHQPHMLQVRIPANPDHDGVVGLIGRRAVSGDKTLQKRRIRSPAELHERAGIGGRRRTRRNMHDMKRLLERRSIGNRDQGAIGSHGCIQRNHRLRSRAAVEEIGVSLVAAVLQRFTQGLHPNASFQRAQIGERRHEHTVDQHQPAGIRDFQRGSAPFCRVPAPPHPAQRRAEALRASGPAGRYISSLPAVDAAGRPARKRRTPAVGHRRPCRCRATDRAPTVNRFSFTRGSGLRFCQSNIHHTIRIRQAASNCA